MLIFGCISVLSINIGHRELLLIIINFYGAQLVETLRYKPEGRGFDS